MPGPRQTSWCAGTGFHQTPLPWLRLSYGRCCCMDPEVKFKAMKCYSLKLSKENFMTRFPVNWIVIFLDNSVQGGKGAMRLTLCEAPAHETRPDHNTGNDVPYKFR